MAFIMEEAMLFISSTWSSCLAETSVRVQLEKWTTRQRLRETCRRELAYVIVKVVRQVPEQSITWEHWAARQAAVRRWSSFWGPPSALQVFERIGPIQITQETPPLHPRLELLITCMNIFTNGDT